MADWKPWIIKALRDYFILFFSVRERKRNGQTFLPVLANFISYCLIEKENFRVGNWFRDHLCMLTHFPHEQVNGRGEMVWRRHIHKNRTSPFSVHLSSLQKAVPLLPSLLSFSRAGLSPKPRTSQQCIYLMPLVVECVSYCFCFLSVAQYFPTHFSG